MVRTYCLLVDLEAGSGFIYSCNPILDAVEDGD